MKTAKTKTIDIESQIRFIDFKVLKSRTEFPRSPDDDSLTTTLRNVDRNNTLLIFVSHCWIRGYPGAEGYCDRPHPDNAEHEKLKLCIAGIEMIHSELASAMKECFVWLDYACIDQDNRSKLPKALKQYDTIVGCCDAIFTPIVDSNYRHWSRSCKVYDFFTDYKAPLWNDGPHAYLNRAWCRAEMMYAANIPILEDSNSESRVAKFAPGFAHHLRQGRRPHFLFGDREDKEGYLPFILPPLQKSWFDNCHPVDGALSDPSDIRLVRKLVSKLKTYLEKNKSFVGYKGKRNKAGLPHGFGREWRSNGDKYEGNWLNGFEHGHGRLQYFDGRVYEGEWEYGMLNGKGTQWMYTGDVYEGEWVKNEKCGQGTLTYVDGDRYVGAFKNNMMHGKGMLIKADGSVFEGTFKNDSREGKGSVRYANGDYFEGMWKSDEKNGKGIHRYADGTVFEGVWKNFEREGQGVLKNADGVVLQEGTWRNDKFVGDT